MSFTAIGVCMRMRVTSLYLFLLAFFQIQTKQPIINDHNNSTPSTRHQCVI